MSHLFCPDCGASCTELVPEGDHKLRSVCSKCDAIHYVNPKVVVGCIVEAGDQLLLAKRNIEPALGLWTFPAGYLECLESAAEGGARETLEETEAEVETLGLFAMLDIPHISQIYAVYRARMVGDHFAPTTESSEVRLISMDDVPWTDLAFPSVATALRLYADDRSAGAFRIHTGIVEWTGEGSRFDLEQYRLRGHLAR
ncbi:MAG: ADP-ribose pyrophosphatase YjhB (NUDIX family) [Planctomycetota bacterium]|jgi:ADP-ribose pyrophosphatase YjhB (NUDIX family)